jgi:hypothetical protein
VATYAYGALEIRVTADTKQLRVDIGGAASQAGTEAAGKISGSMASGLHAAGGLATAVGKSVATGLGVATGAAVAFGVESFKTAARVGEMDAALRAVAKANNLSYEALTENVTAIRKQGIEANVAQNLVAQFARGNLDLSKSSDLARVAQDAAVLSQRNSTEVLDDLVHGIMTQNTQVLRNAGITGVNAVQAQETYAKSLGKSRSELTESEKAQAVLNAVLLEGEKISGTYASAMEEPGKVLRSFKRVTDDIKLSVGEGLVKAFGPLILQTYDLAKALSEALMPGGKLAPVIDAIGVAVTNLVEPLAGLITKWVEWVKNLQPGQIDGIVKIIQRFGPAFLAAGAGLGAFVAPSLLGQVPILGGVLQNLMGPLHLVTGGIAKLAGGALAAVPGLGSLGGAAGVLPAALNPVGAVIVGIVAAIGTLMIASSDFREGVISMGKALWEGLKPALSSVWDLIKVFGVSVWEIVKAIGDALGPALKNLSPLLEQIGKLFGVNLAGGADGAGGAMTSLVPVITGLIKVMGWQLDITTKLLVPLIEIPLKILVWISSMTQALNPLKALGQAIEWLTKIITSLVKWIMGGSPGLIPAFQALLGVVQSVTGVMGGVITSTFNSMVSTVQSATQQISSTVSSTWASMADGARSAGSSMIEGLKSGLSAAKSLGGWMSSNVTGPVTGFLKSGLGISSPSTITIHIGDELVEGLRVGLAKAKEMGSWVMANVASPIISSFKSAFGIGSPSRVMIGIGEDITEGLEEGMAGMSKSFAVPSPLAGGLSGLGGLGAGSGATINVYPSAHQDEQEIAALVSRELAWATAGGLS